MHYSGKIKKANGLSFRMIIDLCSEKETEIIAAKIASNIDAGGLTIGLSGDLGAGKTTFVRYFVQALGSVDPVSSPSFVLQNQYMTAAGLIIEHWDLYRLNELPDELFEPTELNVIRLVEWANRCSLFLDSVDLSLYFEFAGSCGASESRRLVFAGSRLFLKHLAL